MYENEGLNFFIQTTYIAAAIDLGMNICVDDIYQSIISTRLHLKLIAAGDIYVAQNIRIDSGRFLPAGATFKKKAFCHPFLCYLAST